MDLKEAFPSFEGRRFGVEFIVDTGGEAADLTPIMDALARVAWVRAAIVALSSYTLWSLDRRRSHFRRREIEDSFRRFDKWVDRLPDPKTGTASAFFDGSFTAGAFGDLVGSYGPGPYWLWPYDYPFDWSPFRPELRFQVAGIYRENPSVLRVLVTAGSTLVLAAGAAVLGGATYYKGAGMDACIQNHFALYQHMSDIVGGQARQEGHMTRETSEAMAAAKHFLPLRRLALTFWAMSVSA